MKLVHIKGTLVEYGHVIAIDPQRGDETYGFVKILPEGETDPDKEIVIYRVGFDARILPLLPKFPKGEFFFRNTRTEPGELNALLVFRSTEGEVLSAGGLSASQNATLGAGYRMAGFYCLGVALLFSLTIIGLLAVAGPIGKAMDNFRLGRALSSGSGALERALIEAGIHIDPKPYRQDAEGVRMPIG